MLEHNNRKFHAGYLTSAKQQNVQNLTYEVFLIFIEFIY